LKLDEEEDDSANKQHTLVVSKQNAFYISKHDLPFKVQSDIIVSNQRYSKARIAPF